MESARTSLRQSAVQFTASRGQAGAAAIPGQIKLRFSSLPLGGRPVLPPFLARLSRAFNLQWLTN